MFLCAVARPRFNQLDGDGNNFKEPHMDKARLRRTGEHMEVLTCNEDAYNNVMDKLEESFQNVVSNKVQEFSLNAVGKKGQKGIVQREIRTI